MDWFKKASYLRPFPEVEITAYRSDCRSTWETGGMPSVHRCANGEGCIVRGGVPCTRQGGDTWLAERHPTICA